MKLESRSGHCQFSIPISIHSPLAPAIIEMLVTKFEKAYDISFKSCPRSYQLRLKNNDLDLDQKN
jgi:hypothetical protein